MTKEERIEQVASALDGIEVMDAVDILGEALNKCKSKKSKLLVAMPVFYIGKLIESMHGRSALIKIEDDGHLSFSIAANGVKQDIF